MDVLIYRLMIYMRVFIMGSTNILSSTTIMDDNSKCFLIRKSVDYNDF